MIVIDDCVVSETDLRDQVEGSLNMHPSYETVVTRAQLALVSSPHSCSFVRGGASQILFQNAPFSTNSFHCIFFIMIRVTNTPLYSSAAILNILKSKAHAHVNV